MPDYSRLEKLKRLALSLIAPGGQPAMAAPSPQDPLLPHMDTRQQQLQALGGGNTGGMFDIIYKKRKEREQRMREIESE